MHCDAKTLCKWLCVRRYQQQDKNAKTFSIETRTRYYNNRSGRTFTTVYGMCELFQKNFNEDKHIHSEECIQFCRNKKEQKITYYVQWSLEKRVFWNKWRKSQNGEQFKIFRKDLNDNDLNAVETKLTKARITWGQLGKVADKEKVRIQHKNIVNILQSNHTIGFVIRFRILGVNWESKKQTKKFLQQMCTIYNWEAHWENWRNMDVPRHENNFRTRETY